MAEEEITSGARHSIKFFINEKEYTVWETWRYTPESKLVDFIREDAKLKGTKIMCREGGCGTCVVSISETEPLAGTPNAKTVPSCTVPLFSCDGWRITTVEHLGDKTRGYDPIQKSLVDFNAIQCGYCSPGMVMSMYTLQQSKGDANIEDILDGNICRCTGYRPILDAFKSLKSSRQEIRQECDNCPSRQSDSVDLKTHCTVQQNAIELDLASGQKWIKVEDINSAFCVLQSFIDAGKPYRVILGINEQGAYKYDPVVNYLDITYVQELRRYSLGANNNGIVIGSAITITGAIFILNQASKMQGYEYAAQIAKLMERDTNLPTRNVASVGEEMLIKNRHKEFVSDIFVYMEAAGATAVIANSATSWETITLTRFFNMNMNGKILVSLNLPKMANNCYFRVFKISRRYQNCKAIVNAGFLMKVDKQQNYKVIEKPRIVYGGIRPNFVHAWGTEMFLLNKRLLDYATLDGAMKLLDKEVNPDSKQDEPSPSYRKSLTKSLLYKTILGILGEEKVWSKTISGATDIVRRNNKGMQDLGINIADVSSKPLYKPVQRPDANLLSSGEAEFTDDIPRVQRELFGAFVLTKLAKCQLDSVDASEALKMKDVVRFITASDIPGVNNCMVFGAGIPIVDVEPIFVYDKVEAAGQAVGLILAWNREVAYEAARRVKVTYKNAEKPTVRARDSLAKVEDEGKLKKHIQLVLATPPTSIEIATREISGEQEHGYQFHFSLETQSCLAIPQSDSMDVYCATQWMDHTQATIASALGVRDNYVNVTVKRVGGAFGSKITRASHPASACAVAAFVTNHPVRVMMDLETDMRMLSKREPYVCRYRVKFSETGKIVFLKAYLLCESGWTKNEAYAIIKLPYFQNVYSASGWEALTGYLLTDTPANTYCRAPGGLNAIAFIEYIMEHISFVLKKDPLDVRAANYMRLGDPLLIPGEFFDGENLIPRMVEQLKLTGEYDQRKRDVDQFNAANRWKKRGLAVSTSSNIVNYYANTYVAYVAIYHHDGSVAVSHSGIEFGTGVNTKVAQTVATYLDVPLEKVKIKANNSLTGNNSSQSALSISSELNSYAAMQACKILVERLAPFKQQLGVNASLQEIAEIALRSKVDLSASYMFGGPSDRDIQNYVTYQVIFNEVEVDILTGEFKSRRVDIVQDVGHSLNPLVDIGQVEGGYVFGAGLWTTEEIIYDENNGQLLTNNSYSYKPAETRDIPEDFRVALLSNTFNRKGVLQTKASGEPPTNLGVSILFALKKAIDSARKDAGNEDWFQMNGPVSLEDIYTHSLTTSSQFTF